MDHSYLLPMFLIFLLILSITSARVLSYDEFNSDEYDGKAEVLLLFFILYHVSFRSTRLSNTNT
jgi:hypothetical protein